ncbi:C5a anaphylatoxin chemotactic receptor 1-like [Convolutriloba macropyga]|uniref:C5a anaphylatoxin chemotactic receptor 1-like n=1 Tax=Convolutriloba macropyga TaxID=536237 RepID=UPI003F52301E
MIPNSTDNPLEPENGTGDIELGYETPIKVFQAITVWTALFGLPGNIFAYLTASKFTQRSSGQTFIKCLALSDLIAGFQDGVMEAWLAMLGIKFFTLHPLLCRFLGWFTYFSSSAAGVVLLATGFDRMIAISKPIWYKQNSKPRRAKITSILIWVITGLAMLPNFFEYDLKELYCNFVIGNPWSILSLKEFKVYYEFIFFGGFIIPGIAMIIVNLVIVYKLKEKSATVSRSDREVTVCLIVVSVAFCLCLGGLGILARLSLVLKDTNPSVANLINYIRKFPAVLNNSMNFYAYFAASSYFRGQFYETIGLRKTTVGNGRSVPVSRSKL